ncbi:hypothetical protein PybrP1_007032 [[Pythium] brassicae (nom. inval.)]|nr:hypothetical protein PybrP1_007032 [[Pythium] brassicae (nom. inval.)]
MSSRVKAKTMKVANRVQRTPSQQRVALGEQHVITPVPDAPTIAAGTADVAFSCVYEGAVGGGGSTVLCVRVLRNATLEGEWLRPLSRSSGRTPAKRARLSLAAQEELEVFARVQGRVTPFEHAAAAPSVDGVFCCYFDVLPVDGVLPGSSVAACHVHRWGPREGELRGQWVSQRDKPFWISAAAPCELFEQELTRAFEMTQAACSSSVAPRASAHLQREPPAPKLEPVVVTQEVPPLAIGSDQSRLFPLTPGVFEFSGFSIIAPPPAPAGARRRRRCPARESPPARDECFVTLRLLPDGKLQGTSRELLRPQSCRVTGSWRPDRVKYLLEYRVRDAVGLFKYSGRVADGDRSVRGTWRNVDADHAEGFGGGHGEFALELTHATRVTKEAAAADEIDSSRHRITVLTTGAYTLKGCATDDDGYEYACELKVTLLPGGYLRGTSRELVFDQTRPVTGEWSPTFFRYRQEYVVKGDVGRYEYEGQLAGAGDGGLLRGEWGNMDLQDRESRGEHGTFAYGVVSAQRRWSAFSHENYPASFRRGVLTVLLCSARMHALPALLWYRTFEFCHEAWFVGT